jgi:hypothetical protein
MAIGNVIDVDFEDDQPDPASFAEIGEELRKGRTVQRGIMKALSDLLSKLTSIEEKLDAKLDAMNGELQQTHGIVSDERRIRLDREKEAADAAWMAEHLADDEEPTKVG